MSAVVTVLFLALMVWRVGFRHNTLRSADRLLASPEPAALDERTQPARDSGTRDRQDNGDTEPAYQFPGVPRGWSLDQYAHDGIIQLRVLLTQAARRPHGSDPS